MRIRGNNNFIDILSSYTLRFNDGKLNISHDGSHGYVTAATGVLHLRSDASVRLQNESGSPMVYGYNGGAVELYHAGTKKLETASYGVSITGQLVVSSVITANSYLQGNTSSGGFLFYSDSSTSSGVILDTGDDLRPTTNNAQDLGTSSYRWRNVYTTDLQLSNKGKTNDVDGTWGDYTIQEGENDLFLINNRNGKKYTFLLKEVS